MQILLYTGTSGNIPINQYTSLAEQIYPLVQDRCGIVYMDAAKHVSALAIALRHLGVKSCSYQGTNMSSHDKLKALENWRTGEVQVMVSTSAFGMGIDRKDVDVVVKVGVPQTLEDLVQMFGRAGRDGRSAQGANLIKCKDFHCSVISIGILIYSEDDLQMAGYWFDCNKDHSILTRYEESWK